MAFARLWHAKEPKKGIVLIVHDVAEHSQRYQNFALFLAHNGYSVMAYDLRGHGLSALRGLTQDNQNSSKKNLHENLDFGYMPAEGGWYVYLDDLSDMLKYFFLRYPAERNFIFGHGMGSMIVASAFSVLPRDILEPITGVLLSAPLAKGGMREKIKRLKINSQIRRYGDTQLNAQIGKIGFGQGSRKQRFSSLRTEQDWVSSQPEEVDEYIADPLCGNVLRLGMYKTFMEGRDFVYSGRHRRGLNFSPPPLFVFSGGDDPISAYGKGADQLSNVFRSCDWQDVETRLYAGRHDLLRDRLRAGVYADCLAWMERSQT